MKEMVYTKEDILHFGVAVALAEAFILLWILLILMASSSESSNLVIFSAIGFATLAVSSLAFLAAADCKNTQNETV